MMQLTGLQAAAKYAGCSCGTLALNSSKLEQGRGPPRRGQASEFKNMGMDNFFNHSHDDCLQYQFDHLLAGRLQDSGCKSRRSQPFPDRLRHAVEGLSERGQLE